MSIKSDDDQILNWWTSENLTTRNLIISVTQIQLFIISEIEFIIGGEWPWRSRCVPHLRRVLSMNINQIICRQCEIDPESTAARVESTSMPFLTPNETTKTRLATVAIAGSESAHDWRLIFSVSDATASNDDDKRQQQQQQKCEISISFPFVCSHSSFSWTRSCSQFYVRNSKVESEQQKMGKINFSSTELVVYFVLVAVINKWNLFVIIFIVSFCCSFAASMSRCWIHSFLWKCQRAKCVESSKNELEHKFRRISDFRLLLDPTRHSQMYCTISQLDSISCLLALRLLCVKHGNLYDNGNLRSWNLFTISCCSDLLSSDPFQQQTDSDDFNLLLAICLMKIFKLPLESHKEEQQREFDIIESVATLLALIAQHDYYFYERRQLLTREWARLTL